MPTSGITIVKFKRGKSTYVVPLELHPKKNRKLDYFTSALAHAINSSGGIDVDEEPVAQQDPQQVVSEDLGLAFPKSRDAPYENNWLAIADDSAIEAVVFNDYDTLGFKLKGDAEFHITQPEYEE